MCDKMHVFFFLFFFLKNNAYKLSRLSKDMNFYFFDFCYKKLMLQEKEPQND